MSKVLLLIEEPNSCDECMCVEEVGCRRYYCRALYEYIENLEKREHSIIPKICPLRKLPEKEDDDPMDDDYFRGYTNGWNDCLKEIAGGKNK
nr:hypothetical protein [uncultured Lachnoclostridium sp.]